MGDSIFGDNNVSVPGPVDTFIDPVFPDDIDKFQETLAGDASHVSQLKRAIDSSFHEAILSSLRDVDAKQQEEFVFLVCSFAGGTRMGTK